MGSDLSTIVVLEECRINIVKIEVYNVNDVELVLEECRINIVKIRATP